MPNGDGTGPMGRGPRTGRDMGFGAGVGASGPINMNPDRGFGTGCGRGIRGRGVGGGRGPSAWLRAGWRNMFHATGLPAWARGTVPAATPAPPQELAGLKQQIENLGSALESIRKRIQEVESQPGAK